MSGSHRTTVHRPADRRVGLVIAGVAAGVVACVVAAAVVLNTVISTGSSELSGGSRVESSPVSSQLEQASVPDACTVLPADLTDELVPGAHVTQNDPFEADDRNSQCTWGTYGDQARQLTVQLRAVAAEGGDSGSRIATNELQDERRADEAGEGLRPGQEVTSKQDLEGVGDEGYLVYSRTTSRASAHGEGIVNVRSGNILISVHFAGTEGERPMSENDAIDGATKAAKRTVEALSA